MSASTRTGDTTLRGKLTLWQRIMRVWPYFSGSRVGWAWAVGATIVASATEPFVPALLKPLLDRGFQTDTFNLWLVPAALMLLFTIRGLSGFVAQFALAKVTNDGLLRLRQAMFSKLLTARLSLFADQTSSAIANTVVYEVFNGSSMLITSVLKLARDLLTLLALIAYLLYLNWKLTLVVALLFPAVALVIQVLSRRLYRLTKESQVATDNLAYVVEENVLANRDVRLHGAQASQAGRFDVLNNSLRRLSMKSTAAYAGMSAITQVLAAMALSAVVSIALLQSAENTTTVGGFVAAAWRPWSAAWTCWTSTKTRAVARLKNKERAATSSSPAQASATKKQTPCLLWTSSACPSERGKQSRWLAHRGQEKQRWSACCPALSIQLPATSISMARSCAIGTSPAFAPSWPS